MRHLITQDMYIISGLVKNSIQSYAGVDDR